MKSFKLFLTAFVQVYLVAINTICLAHSVWVGVAIMSFFISFTWTYNVSKIAIGAMRDRIIYSAGAMLGSICGLLKIGRAHV
jgi:hypothetical protein